MSCRNFAARQLARAASPGEEATVSTPIDRVRWYRRNGFGMALSVLGCMVLCTDGAFLLVDSLAWLASLALLGLMLTGDNDRRGIGPYDLPRRWSIGEKALALCLSLITTLQVMKHLVQHTRWRR
jgi:hypothetical protein